MKLYVLLVVTLSCAFSIASQPKLTIDEFFDSTDFPFKSISPNGRYLLVNNRRPAWDSNEYENNLWLYETQGERRKLITKHLSKIISPKWSPSGNAIVLLTDKAPLTNSKDNDQDVQSSEKNNSKTKQYLQLYNIKADKWLAIDIGNAIPTAIAWANDDTSLYFAATKSSSNENHANNTINETEWKDVIRYRQPKPSDKSMISRIDISKKKRRISVKINPTKMVDFQISELLYVPLQKKLILLSAAAIVEKADVFEIYSIDLNNPSTLTRLTNNEDLEQNVQLSIDGKHVFYITYPLGANCEKLVQSRLYSIDLTNGQHERWGKDFNGGIRGFAVRSEGGVFILGQLRSNVQIYMQQSPSKSSILLDGWNGTYQMMSSSSLKGKSSIAFSHSSFEQPEEVYFVHSIEQLRSAKAITNENSVFTKRNLPKASLYHWINPDDGRAIEGILHYPPGKFQCKNLPLLVLIHGGPTDASLNLFHANWYSWAPMAATEGWLVFEPNYRGSTGYGDQFVNEIAGHSLDRPGKDILAGVDRLIEDGIADPHRLAIGGFSYGGFLTNWLITQTTRFNAALSGAGLADQVSTWGMMDLPAYIRDIVGGFPWEVPQTYLNESPIYQLNKVRTPTHIVTGANDERVPTDQSYILERGLYYLGIPVQLLLFPNTGHALGTNPWYGKIKVREELKWLEKYGHSSSNKTTK